MAALPKPSVPQPAAVPPRPHVSPPGGAPVAPAVAGAGKEKYLKDEEAFLRKDREEKQLIQSELGILNEKAPKWKGDFLFRAEMTKSSQIHAFCARSVPAALEGAAHRKAADEALRVLHNKDEEDLLKKACVLVGNLYEAVRAKIQIQLWTFKIQDMQRVRAKVNAGLALSEVEKETKKRADELVSEHQQVVERTKNALMCFVKQSADGQIINAVKEKYKDIFDLLDRAQTNEFKQLDLYFKTPVPSSAEFAPASHAMEFEAQEKAWGNAPPSFPLPPLEKGEEKWPKPEPVQAPFEVKNGSAPAPASPLYAAPAAAAKPGGAQWDAEAELLAEKMNGARIIDGVPVCDAALVQGAEGNKMKYVFVSGDCRLPRLGQVMKVSESTHRIHGIEVNHPPGGICSRASTCVLPVSPEEVKFYSSGATTKAVLSALQVSLHAELLKMAADRLPMLGTPVAACTGDQFKFWTDFIGKRPEGSFPLGVHSHYACIKAPDGSDIGPVPLVPIAGDKQDKSTGLPLLAPLKQEYDESAIKAADFRITVEAGRITLGYNSKEGRVTLTDTVPMSKDHWKIPVIPGATKAETWRYMGQTGVGVIPCPAESRQTFGLPEMIKDEGRVIRNSAYYKHPTCLVMTASEVKTGKEKEARTIKNRTRYVFFTARGTILIIDPNEKPGIAVLEAMKAGTKATERCQWSTPGKSAHTMSNVGAWLKEMQTNQYKHLVTRELRDAAMLAWANVDVYQMLMGARCPRANLYMCNDPKEECELGTPAAIYYYTAFVHPVGLSEYLIPLLFEMFTVAFEKHGMRPS